MKQLATTLTDAATPQWHGTMSRVGMVGMIELTAFRWCLWLGGVHALREASKRKALLSPIWICYGGERSYSGDSRRCSPSVAQARCQERGPRASPFVDTRSMSWAQSST